MVNTLLENIGPHVLVVQHLFIYVYDCVIQKLIIIIRFSNIFLLKLNNAALL